VAEASVQPGMERAFEGEDGSQNLRPRLHPHPCTRPREWKIIVHSSECIKKMDCLECKYHKFRSVKQGLDHYRIRQLILGIVSIYCPINPARIRRQGDGTLDGADAKRLLDEALDAYVAQGLAPADMSVLGRKWKFWRAMLMRFLLMKKGDIVYQYARKRVWAVGKVLDNAPRLDHISEYPEGFLRMAVPEPIFPPPLAPAMKVAVQGEEYLFPNDVNVGPDSSAPGDPNLWRCNWAVRRVSWTWLPGGEASELLRKTFVSLGNQGQH